MSLPVIVSTVFHLNNKIVSSKLINVESMQNRNSKSVTFKNTSHRTGQAFKNAFLLPFKEVKINRKYMTGKDNWTFLCRE